MRTVGRIIGYFFAFFVLAACLAGFAGAEGEPARAEVTDNENNRFTITASGLSLPENCAAVRFAIWSEADGQDDLFWYVARQTPEGGWAVFGTMAEHDYAGGTYCVHIYAFDEAGEPTILGMDSVTLTGSRPDFSSGIDPSRPMVALTYDDGPYSPVTLRILDALEAVNGRATFFVVGNRVAGCASVIRRANVMGCQIGNHTWDHTLLTGLPAAEITGEVERCSDAVAEVIGRPTVLVRPVGGMVDTAVRDAIDTPMILWSVDTKDWETQDAAKTCDAVIGHVQDGDIILMHDLYPATAEASERIIPELVRQGFQLVTVEELARYRGVALTGHTTYSQFR